jgi:hypothetical protein
VLFGIQNYERSCIGSDRRRIARNCGKLKFVDVVVDGGVV